MYGAFSLRTMLKKLHGSCSRKFSTGKNIPLVINGKDVTTEQTFPVISPVTGREAYRCSSVSPQLINDAVKAAHTAFPAWSKTKPSNRRDILLRAADIMEKRRVELGSHMYHELGSTLDFQNFIIDLSIEGLRDTAGKIAGAVTGTVPQSVHDGMRAMVLRRPYGVNLGIAPWNGGYHLGLRSITFPLAAGNTAVLKGAEFAPAIFWSIADIFREAGLPDGCLNLVFHRPADAPATIESLICHPQVRKINFTGSTRVGSIISSMAGKYLKPVLMELGGKASAIVMGDADLDKAAMHCALGAFFNAGQICMSTERILVHSSIAAEFQSVLRKTIDKLFGSPKDTPILVRNVAARRNRSLVNDALSKGAIPLDIFNSKTDDHEKSETRMRPVVLTGVDKTMDLYQDESFGPSVSLFTFDTEEDAIKLANNTEYGLSASVFSENLRTAFRIAEALDSGAVHINTMTVHDEYSLPHGGVKQSGFGRFNSYQGLEEFLHYKTLTWME